MRALTVAYVLTAAFYLHQLLLAHTVQQFCKPQQNRWMADTINHGPLLQKRQQSLLYTFLQSFSATSAA